MLNHNSCSNPNLQRPRLGYFKGNNFSLCEKTHTSGVVKLSARQEIMLTEKALEHTSTQGWKKPRSLPIFKANYKIHSFRIKLNTVSKHHYPFHHPLYIPSSRKDWGVATSV